MTNSTKVGRWIDAPRSAVYDALIDAEAIAKWKFPDGMQIVVHEHEKRQGGAFRISLTYDSPVGAGKTTAHTDTYRGRYVELVPDEKVVEEDRFESDDPNLSGMMRITITLAEANGGTYVEATHEGLPSAVSIEDNETGWRMSLEKLSAFVEGAPGES